MKTDKATILVVDDNPLNLKVLFQYLSDAGYRVLVAEDGENAVEQTVHAQPDLVLLDVLMPGLNGFETCRRLKEDGRTQDIPVIFLTALSATEDKLEGFQAGGVDYLSKPLQYDEVVARVETHLKLSRLTHELEEKNEVLEELDRKKNILMSILAHDLRSPVVSFVSGARVLREIAEEGTDIHQIAVQLSTNADRLNDLLEDLLYWSQLVLQNRGVERHLVDPHSVVTLAIAMVESEVQRKSQCITVDIPENLTIYAEPQAITSVVRNLLSNAVKFTPVGGRISVAVSSDGERTTIAVRDTGTGMTSEELEHVFDPKRRVRKQGTAGEGGSGFGLTLCRELVAGQGGEMTAESVSGDGSAFSVRLPAGPDHPEASQQPRKLKGEAHS